MRSVTPSFLALALVLPACVGGQQEDGTLGAGGRGGKADDPVESTQPAAGLGTGDHSPSSVHLKLVVKASRLNGPAALAFAADAPEDLWIVNEADDSWTIVDDVGTASQRIRRYHDDSDHFLNGPTAIAFASADEHAVATCNESLNDYNGMAIPDGFMGPVAWTTDRARFSGGHMSHYDMAHEEPLCMGIAWERAHVWWTFNGYDSSLDRVDFHGWHPDKVDGLGGQDHSDGTIERYAAGEVRRVEGVPSHMAIDPGTGMLYVADTGHHRIVRLDTDASPSCHDLLGRFGEMALQSCSGELEEIVTPEVTFDQPSGLALQGGLLYVTDHADGRIVALTTGGTLMNWLDTGRGADALTGVAVSPAGVVYFIDGKAERLYRVDPIAP